jgi:hypothetical protein
VMAPSSNSLVTTFRFPSAVVFLSSGEANLSWLLSSRVALH